jgi:hypothetical protein
MNYLVTGLFKKRAAAGLPLEIHGDGSQTRDFVHVDDVAEANILAMESDITNDTINVGTGTQVSIKELADLISPNQVYKPKRKVDLQATLCDTTKIEHLLHWKPTRNIRESILTIVTSHWNEDLTWLKKSRFPVVLIDKEGAAPTCFIPQHVIPNKGNDTAVIFTYIIKNYDCLPDHVAFIHGHEKSYHQLHDRDLLEVIESANVHKYSYIPLNNVMREYIFCNEIPSNGEPVFMLYDYVIKLGIKPLRALTRMTVPVGSQFITNRERIQSVPKEIWKKWLETLLSADPHDAKIIPIVFEYMLHIILGEMSEMVLETDWFSFPYKVKWFHEIPQLCLPEKEWRAMGLEPIKLKQ